jgi:hypothetical protein
MAEESVTLENQHVVFAQLLNTVHHMVSVRWIWLKQEQWLKVRKISNEVDFFAHHLNFADFKLFFNYPGKHTWICAIL